MSSKSIKQVQKPIYLTSTVPRHLSAACLAISNRFCFLIWCFLYTTSIIIRPMPPMMPAPTSMKTPAIFFRPSVFGVFSNSSHFWLLPWKIHSLSNRSIKPPKVDVEKSLKVFFCVFNGFCPFDKIPIFFGEVEKKKLTFMKLQNVSCYEIRPRTAFLKANAIAASTKKLTSSDELTIFRCFVFQTRWVPDESHQFSKFKREDGKRKKFTLNRFVKTFPFSDSNCARRPYPSLTSWIACSAVS